MKDMNPITFTKKIRETTTPTALPDVGQIYTKSDGLLYFQNGAGSERTVCGRFDNKVYSFSSPPGGSGTFYTAGFYGYSATDANLSQASTTQTLGTANISYAAHAFVVAGGAGTTDGDFLVLNVGGTSIDDEGNRTAGDSEELIFDCRTASLNGYYETDKKWIGQVTFSIISNGFTYGFDFNYGFAKYEDFGNVDFTTQFFECVGRAGATDSGFNVRLLKHCSTGWVYHATAFKPSPTEICSIQTDHNTEYQLLNANPFAYKRTNLSTSVTGSGLEGVIVEVTTTANNAVELMNITIGAAI